MSVKQFVHKLLKMDVTTKKRGEVSTEIPVALHGEIIELSPAAITTLLSTHNPNRVGMIVLSDDLKRVHRYIMPMDKRGEKLLEKLPENTVVALKRVEDVEGRFVILP